MEFDHNLLFNFVPIFSSVLLVLVTSATVFHRLKLRWPVKVNCWFCNKNTKVWRQELDWWLCPSCEQYNGFSKNGDYTYSIPEQYKNSSNNSKRYCTATEDTKSGETAGNNLCKTCNTRETLKLSKLSKFEPLSERNYDYEVAQFKQSLEEKYPLCANCQTTVHNVLQKQTLWLAQYKMLFFRQKPISAIINNANYSGSVFRIISTILDSTIAYNSDQILLPIGGLFFQLCACWLSPAKRWSSDVLVALLWICIIVLLPFKDMRLMKTDFENTFFSIEYLTQYHVIMMFAFMIGFINIIPASYKNKSNKNMSFKKIETSSKNNTLSESCTSTLTNDSQNYDSKMNSNLSETIMNSQTSMNLINGSMPVNLENAIISKSRTSNNPLTNQDSYMSPKAFNSTSFFTTIPSYKSNISDNYSLNDSLNTLNSLCLSDSVPKQSAKAPKVFERKVYCTKSPDLFKKFSNTSSKKYILSPPKLKSVMQTSWVAGGYWQEGIDPPSLSRSSSQSSGFGSAGSNFAPSREPSVHEFDQCSVMSDATQSCYASRPNSVSPAFSQQTTQFAFPEPKSPVCGPAVKYAPSHAFTPQPLLVSTGFHRNGSIFADQCLQGQRMNVSDMKSTEMQIFPSHTTIVTSPVWLPALLCGSLVLNIIVLCTTLLR